MKAVKTMSSLVLASVLVYGCGGGGGSAPSPNGIYTGSITGGATGGAPINGGEKAIIYNNRIMVFSTALDIQQLFDMAVTVDGMVISGTLDYYNNSTPLAATSDVDGEYVSSTSATLNFSDATSGYLPSGVINLSYSSDLYSRDSSLGTVAGTWNGTHGNNGDATTLTIDQNGGISGFDTFCTFTGSIAPANTSVNVYEVTIQSQGGASCTSLPSATYTGFAWIEGTNNETLNFTVADGTNSRSVVPTKM